PPGFALCLHPLEQFHGAAAMQQEVLVHHEKRAHFHGSVHFAHDFEKFFPSLIEDEELSLAAEEGRSSTEDAPQWATDRGDDGGRDVEDSLAMRGQMPRQSLARRRIEQGGSGGWIVKNHREAPGAMEHPRRKGPLGACHLIVVTLRRIATPPAQLTIQRVGS